MQTTSFSFSKRRIRRRFFLDELTKVTPVFGHARGRANTEHATYNLGEALEVVERFTYLGSFIFSDCSVTGECRRIRNEVIRRRVFGCATVTFIEECV
ncbi:hypothetical protein T265_00644 [Opisthorchis viverrini]|uniref:Uncharacterized protein n=1 Tax=Opisthorchis viverrini TaxID=6198 RepID=A0A075AJK3_OPIVI|nr:hypothetical protein T265_00644 [Opisthorchis viverrini]KER33534.1 hypothetical protein T265_00644 [Opisthorchis viverrini]